MVTVSDKTGVPSKEVNAQHFSHRFCRRGKKRGRKKKGEVAPEISLHPKDLPALSRYVRMRPGQILKALPQECDWGCKKNSQGKVETWKGFKLHVLSADGEIPLACVLTGASVHDSQAAPYLLKRARERTTFLYGLADAAYDAKAIKDLVCHQGGVPNIDANPRRGKTKSPMDPDRERRYKKTIRSGTDLFPSQGRVRRDNDSRERKPKGRIPSHVCRSGS